MNTCDTCKWWGKTLIGMHRYGQNKKCDHIKRDGGVNYCESVSPIHDGNFLSELFTGPKFGCVHWEGKP